MRAGPRGHKSLSKGQLPQFVHFVDSGFEPSPLMHFPKYNAFYLGLILCTFITDNILLTSNVNRRVGNNCNHLLHFLYTR